ncbi:hypothetical protein DPEC_G00167800 [Dallia pectoralis]|uniref:Uncharacterized protein n=1 Tax=Dallia pectoralis TaxID=75939 RepID=A0ACC2GIC9_DALPE|nr:hypothetical protein DPEC_G00167800 [Dallia pectoralis]
MTSRRPLTRSYSGNGRSVGGTNEEELSSSNGRTESCNYLSNVRPENRSTLFGVMAQLTEDTQPVFETTLKSKAVSENANVMLTCVVTGNPAPDLKWYRDDMELDRYCGLPKYKIIRNGKTHTLYIYSCSMDDAAIYQASASNSKGIVSCSGVLEVGTMSEFKIHQRFFAKLKQKAENKRRELDEGRRRGNENLQKESCEAQPPRSSPIPPLRRRHNQMAPISPLDEEEHTVSQGGATVEQPDTSVCGHNGESKTHNNDFDNMDIVTSNPLTTGVFAKTKMKISNGVDSMVVGISRNPTGSSSKENKYDGGKGLSHMLSEALNSQTDDVEADKVIDTTVADPKTNAEKGIEKWGERTDRERMFGKEQEREKIIEREMIYEIEKEKAREADELERKTAQNVSSEVKMESKPHTQDQHGHHIIQDTISNVLHSVKGFFFGKSKKDNSSHDHLVKAQEKVPPSPPSQPFGRQNPPPEELDSQLEVSQIIIDKTVSEESDGSKVIIDKTVSEESEGSQKAQIDVIPLQKPVSSEQMNPPEHKHGYTVSFSEKAHVASHRAVEHGLVSLEHVEQTPVNVCLKEINTERVATSGHPALCEAAKNQFQTEPVPQIVLSVPQEPNSQMISSRTDQVTKYDHNTEDFKEQTPSGSSWKPNPTTSAECLHLSNDTGIRGGSPRITQGLVTIRNGKVKEMQEKEKELLKKVQEKKGSVSVYETQEDTGNNEGGNRSRMETGDVKTQQPILTADHNVNTHVKTQQPILTADHNVNTHVKTQQPILTADHNVNTHVKTQQPILTADHNVNTHVKTQQPILTADHHVNTHVKTQQPILTADHNVNTHVKTQQPILTADHHVNTHVKTQQPILTADHNVNTHVKTQQPIITSDHNVNTQNTYVDARQENDETILSRAHIEYIPVLASGEKINNKNIYFKNPEECSPILPKQNQISTDLKTPKASLPMTRELIEKHDLNTKLQSAVKSEESVESAFKVECIPPLKERLADNSYGTLTTQKQVTPCVLKSEEQNVSLERNEVLTPEIEETVNEIKVGESKSEQEPQPERNSATEQAVTSQEIEDVKLGGYFVNIPEITAMDSALKIPYFKISLPEQEIRDQMVTPNTEETEPEVKDPMQTLSVLKPNEPMSVVNQNEVANELSDPVIAGNSASVIPAVIHVTPTQESMWDDDVIRPTEKVQEITQPFGDTTTPTTEQPNIIQSECLKAKDSQLIPTINVFFTEDRQLRKTDDELSLVKFPVLDTVKQEEAPKLTPFKALPFSAICENSLSESPELPKNVIKDSESVKSMQKELKRDLECDISLDKGLSPQKQTAETKKQGVTENTCSLSNKALMPKEVTTIILKAEDTGVTETDKMKPQKESRIESYIIGDEPRDRTSIERLAVKPPTPPRSPSSLRRLMSRTPPAITVDDPANNEKAGSEQSAGDTSTSSLSCESSPRLKRRDSLTLIRSATPEELASGARRKIFIPREGEGVGVVVALGVGGSPLDTQVKKEAPYMSPNQTRRAAFLQAPAGTQTPPLERRSPLLGRKKATLEVPKVVDQANTEEPESPEAEVKPPEKKLNPFKAPQVIRKIRGEPFPDASGHLKLWCQFFNVLSDSIIKWYKDEEEILEVKRSGGDESQVALAIVQTSSQDCGVYGCSIKNEFGTDSTDFLLSVDILSEYFLREDLEVGEEIEMTSMLFTKGLADPGNWGEKLFGRIMTLEAHLGEGCVHKACRAKVIYGLDPVFESGSTCIIKIQNPIAYGTKEESNLAERNMEITKQECKIQNTVREYCKIFTAEARVIENFGFSLEVSPLYLMYRPANSVPYATVETDLKGVFLKYCMMDDKGRLITRSTSEVEMKCCSFQHWIYQWTNGNLLITGLEGVGLKITKIRIVTKSRGYQGLTEDGSPKVFDQFHTQHQCNYYCGLLSLRTLKPVDTLLQPPKTKSSRSPLLNRKSSSSSPQLNKKLGSTSPQLNKKLGSTSPQP